MKFTGYIEDERVTIYLDAGILTITHADGTEEPYNDEYYGEDQYSTIRFMLIRDGVRDLRDAD